MTSPSPIVRRRRTDELSDATLASMRALFDAAWPAEGDDERFTDEDFEHAVGGLHLFVEIDGIVVSHASVVPRALEVDGRPLRTGYVEAVATLPAYRRRGLGTAVVADASEHVDAAYELGALGTDLHGFYERLGWETWRGPTAVRVPDGDVVPTPEEDGCIMVRRTPATPPLDLAAPIVCDWRPGDVW
jgi:aminoglycoside 2'-N-acetyltransferase I